MKNLLISATLALLFLSCQNKESAIAKSEINQSLSESEVERNLDKEAYFGDLHIHTSWSFDAFIYNTRTTPDDAYMYGKGEPIPFSSGGTIQSNQALDFMAVTDHAEYMGIMKQMIDPESHLFNIDIAKRIRNKDRAISASAFGDIGLSLSRSTPIEEFMDIDIRKNTWDRIQEVADKHYEPGKFTTFPAYEFTSTPGDSIFRNGSAITYAQNLHRNVIFKGDKVSDIPYSSFDSQNPEDLWDWMDKERANGIELMAIPHNGNMSNGLMYANSTFDGSPMTLEYINQRMRNEPINEVVQVKGTSMSHPLLSKNDEFADFELYAWTFTIGPYVPSKEKGSYVREAYKDGLTIEKELGGNPFKFGVIGSSDGHTSSGSTDEDNYYGKFGGNRDGTPKDRLQSTQNLVKNEQLSAAGLAGVWAESNTRSDIFNGLKTKETYATSGSRIKVRLFGGVDKGFDFSEGWVSNAYKQGVAMGQDLNEGKDTPRFAMWAIKDPNGANLDRIQVIKSWLDKDGKASEKIYDIAWSGDRTVGSNGKLAPVGNTVDVKDASYTNDIGTHELKAVWEDPDFDADAMALYYVRVLEIPTPRWSTYDAKKLGITIPDNLDATIQERAWSSPIWYNP